MALTVQFQLNPRAEPFVPIITEDKMLQYCNTVAESGRGGGGGGDRDRAPGFVWAGKMDGPTGGGKTREIETSLDGNAETNFIL